MSKSITDLEKELAGKKRLLNKLESSKARLLSRLKAIDRQISSLAGADRPMVGRRGRGVRPRARRGGRPSLGDVLATVMQGKRTVKVAEAAKLVLGAGYKTIAKQFGNIVSQTLKKDARFRKVRRGTYKLKV